MKFTVSSAELLGHLNITNGVISSNTVLPILEDYIFQLVDGTLTITSSNNETTIITKLDVAAQEDGIMAIPAKILLETLKALPEQPVTFEQMEGEPNIKITSSFGRYILACDDPSEYPELPDIENATNSLLLSSNLLSDVLAKTLFATSNDELRTAMQGLFFQIQEQRIIFVATDAHKLVRFSHDTASTNHSGSFIVPKKGLSLLKNALIANSDVDIRYNDSHVFFLFEDTKVIIRLIDAKYPDYNAVIPIGNNNQMRIDKNDFQSSLKRIAIYANKSTHQVVLNLTENSLTLSAQDLDFSNEAVEQLSCEYDGEPMNIGFSSKVLLEMLSVIGVDNISLNLSNPVKAGILEPTQQEENQELIMLVMPVILGN